MLAADVDQALIDPPGQHSYIDAQTKCEYVYGGEGTYRQGQSYCNDFGAGSWWLLGDILLDSENKDAYKGDPCSFRFSKGIEERIANSKVGAEMPWVPDDKHAKVKQFYTQKARVRGYDVGYGHNHYVDGESEWFVTLVPPEESSNVVSIVCARKAPTAEQDQ